MPRIAPWTPLLAAALLLWYGSPASAQTITTYSNPTAFQTAVGATLSTQDFESLNDQDVYDSLVYGDLTLAAPNGFLESLAPGSFGFPFPSMVVIGNGSPDSSQLDLDFNSGLTAVAFEVIATQLSPRALSPAGSQVVVTVEGTDGVQSQTITLTPGGPTFIGLTASGGTISRVSLSNPAAQALYMTLDNVQWGNVVQAPTVDPLAAALDELAAAVAQGRQNGSIRKLGTSLEDKVAAAQAAAAAEDPAGVASALKGLASQVKAQRGKFITAATADLLLAKIADCLAVL
jgi:hypothetical protein